MNDTTTNQAGTRAVGTWLERALAARRRPAPTVIPAVPSVKQAQHALWFHGDPLGVEPDDRTKERWGAYTALPTAARQLIAQRHPGFAEAYDMSFDWSRFDELRSIVKAAQMTLDGLDSDGYVRRVYR